MADDIADLKDCSFTLHKLGPLLEFFAKPLKHWETDLSKHLARQLKLKTWTSEKTNKNVTYNGDLVSVYFQRIHFDGLQFYNTDLKPLKISIEIVYYSKRGRQVHTFFLLPSSYAPRQDSVFAYYPLVLARAPSTVVNQMIMWFKLRFYAPWDSLNISPDIMVETVRIWVDSIVNLKQDYNGLIELVPASMTAVPLHLEYTTADPALSAVHLSLPIDEAFTILDMVPQNQFYDSFCRHVYETTGIVLSSIVLHRVTTSMVIIRKDGLFKINGSAHKVYAVKLLQILIELAASQMY